MPLVKSVSGIRGTIGGVPGENLTPVDIIAFVSAYADFLKARYTQPTVVIGRDGRISGPYVSNLVVEALRAMGVHVIDAGLSTTPSVEMYVPHAHAQGGIVITASHNPREWNALKFLNAKGEFISQEDGQEILATAARKDFAFASIDDYGTYAAVTDSIAYHISRISSLSLVDVETIRSRKFHVVVDCINSTGAIAIPALLDELGCSYTLLNAEVTGDFAHNPEPLAEHLQSLCAEVAGSNAILGIAVDPDVDRLALVDEHGVYYGEEYTLVTVADYILQHTPGPCVSNLSSSMALRDLAQSYQQEYRASKVGEVHVVVEMKSCNAVIGGEGNGGIIYPPLHYGRDALVGIALLLTYRAQSGKSFSALRSAYPHYEMAKNKIELPKGVDVPMLLEQIAQNYPGAEIDTRDGVKINLDASWIHLRASNTEPIIRIYSEAGSAQEAEDLGNQAKEKLQAMVVDG